MSPLRTALLAALMPGAIALIGLVLGLLLNHRAESPPAGRPGSGGGGAARTGGATGSGGRLAAAGAAGLGVALSFFLIQEQLKPGSTGLWPTAAINRAASLSVVCALVGVVVGLSPRSRLVAPLTIATAGAIFAWGLGGPVSGSAGRLALWIVGAAAWGAVVGGFWHAAVWRSLADRASPAPLVASALIPLGAAPVFFFGGGSLLPQPAMSLVAVAGATIAAALVVGSARIAAVAGAIPALLASGTLLLACAMVTNYRPSFLALGVLMAAPLALLPSVLLHPKRALARWALAIVPVAIVLAAAALLAWQMAPADDGYGYY